MRFPAILLTAAALGLSPATAPAQMKVDTSLYAVVINHEEQYSLWPADREPPRGWRAEGEKCTEKACIAYIEEVWTDMRPLALQQNIEELRKLYE